MVHVIVKNEVKDSGSRSRVRIPPGAQCCVLEQDTSYWFNPGKHFDMTEILLTGMLNLNGSKQTKAVSGCLCSGFSLFVLAYL